MFDFIVSNQAELKTDFVTWVGDNSAHNTWRNTKEEVTKYTKYISNLLKSTVAKQSDLDI